MAVFLIEIDAAEGKADGKAKVSWNATTTIKTHYVSSTKSVEEFVYYSVLKCDIFTHPSLVPQPAKSPHNPGVNDSELQKSWQIH